MEYLLIENEGVCPIEGFTLLGASLADSGSIGQFGSGAKHGVTVCLRHSLDPIVYCGNSRLSFSVREQVIADSQSSKTVQRVCVQEGSRAPRDLGFVLDYGRQDWTHVALAMREFVSNAIDQSVRVTGGWDSVRVEVVKSGQVRAKNGYTRIFVPMSPEVREFYADLDRWFLHFSEPESLQKTLLPKRNRNFHGRSSAVIYRRGVLVREFSARSVPSLFDYNLNELSIDEVRKASDWDVLHACGRALADADVESLVKLFAHYKNGGSEVWEGSFSEYALESGLSKGENWVAAFDQVAFDHEVLSMGGTAPFLVRKGYTPLIVPVNIAIAANKFGVRNALSVLTRDDQNGVEVIDPKPAAIDAVNMMWRHIEQCNLTQGKTKPPVKCFRSILSGEQLIGGFYRDGVVYINEQFAGGELGGSSERLLLIALEELAHYITGATDNSRDFQDYLLHLAVKLTQEASTV